MKEGHVHDQQGDDPYHKDYYNLMERERKNEWKRHEDQTISVILHKQLQVINTNGMDVSFKIKHGEVYWPIQSQMHK